ncbi:MFS transporter [Solemya velum gill symbiont]|uniref:MFS transporter n=1 Tax=Solemya velum gill symbiont TaxID=2340 RepID=UPI0005B7AA05|nr:MFS transporter [Solemya velum gill symbiont]OOZ16281.1 MFS transporter [Solemya velum gill symbiont]OOZ20734.1 MFS transporter [Solemya velum gill symbiont]OOZ23268.1 MFS transporter [Solemya velum gill symbiont]OOZ24188.1 MFS transporter [Solemya velum gill symbiont]OOZ30339.1 MFS transporter [Solemya velum gill symbiont]
MRDNWRTPLLVLVCGSLVLLAGYGVRHTYGLFLQPMSISNGWGREIFSFAIAVQNIVWGITQPFTGRIADRYGAGPVVLVCGLLYAAGHILMSYSSSEISLVFAAGVLIGIALSGTTASVIFGVIGRSVSEQKRSAAMGIAMAVGSLGQFAFLPAANHFISFIGWQQSLLLLALVTAVIIPLAIPLMEKECSIAKRLPLKDILSEAWNERDFWLLSLGFFVCGFQVVFIGTHLPAFLVDEGLGPATGATALALIGLFNIFGTYCFGYLGGKMSKPYLLVSIYSLRSLVTLIFILFPITQTTVYIFSSLMGFLWLSTVPLTNGIVATLFGTANLSMLSGIVFLLHQVGAFLGGWMGGYFYDRLGNYDSVWMIAIALSIMAALLNFPIRERPVGQLVTRST